LFVSPPEDYEGGELCLPEDGGDRCMKLAAGDLFIYPSCMLHSVSTVTRGVRLAIVFWVQSMVRDHEQRDLISNLDAVIGSLAALSEDTIIIGAATAPNLGAAYLYRLNFPVVPRLRIASLPGGNVRVTWPSAAIGWALESTVVLGSAQTNQWNQVPSFLYQTNDAEIFLTTNPANHPRFYRLVRP